MVNSTLIAGVLILCAAQQIFNAVGAGIGQAGQTQSRHRIFAWQLAGFNLGRGLICRYIGPFIDQLGRIFGFAFQRSGKILTGHTGLWAALTKAFHIGHGFSRRRNGGESRSMQIRLNHRHLVDDRRRRQGKYNAPYDYRFSNQSHVSSFPLSLFRESLAGPTFNRVKTRGKNRYKFASIASHQISLVLTLAGQVMVKVRGLSLARVKDVIDDDEQKLKPLSAVLLLGAIVLSGMIVYNAFAQGSKPRAMAALPIGATTHMDVAVAADPNNTVILKYDPLVEDVQRQLLATGIYRGMVDGVIGQRTKIAIQQYQQLNGLPITGEVSADLINHIKFTRKVEAASQFTGSVAPAEQKPNAPATAAAPSPLANAALNLKIKKVQVALAGLGYDISTLDGKLNEETHAAILKFEMDNGLTMDGVIDATLISALKIAAN